MYTCLRANAATYERGRHDMERIESRKNPLCVTVRRLAADGASRREQGLFVCDSPKLLSEILAWRPELLSAVITSRPEALPSMPETVRAYEVSAELMEYLSPAKTPQGTLALCRLLTTAPPEKLTGQRYLALDAVQDPGNVGTILRTADALGCEGVFLLPGCADPFSPKTVRATMGALVRLPVWQCTARTLSALLKAASLPLIGAALRADTRALKDTDLTRGCIAIGSEGRGLGPEMLETCDATVRIPMRAHCESLNAAAAATILLWESCRHGAAIGEGL